MIEGKDSFKFEYAKPSSDWFEMKQVEIKPNDYLYFRIERRYGPSWWLIGMNPIHEPKYRWEYTQIADISESVLQRFIEWAKSGRGSRIVEIKAISADFDIIGEILKVEARGPKATGTTEIPNEVGP